MSRDGGQSVKLGNGCLCLVLCQAVSCIGMGIVIGFGYGDGRGEYCKWDNWRFSSFPLLSCSWGFTILMADAFSPYSDSTNQ